MQSHVSAARVALPAPLVPEPQLHLLWFFCGTLNSCAPSAPSGPSCSHSGAEAVTSHHNDAVNPSGECVRLSKV